VRPAKLFKTSIPTTPRQGLILAALVVAPSILAALGVLWQNLRNSRK
jgi:hypothetical protein